MDQFNSAWKYTFSNWKYFIMLALPVIAIESLTAFLIIPLAEISQPEDFIEFFENNSLVISMVGLIGVILQISFLGGIWVSYLSIDKGKEITPVNALQAGLTKFFPLFGAYILIAIVSFFGYILLILPGIYLTARFSLFAAQIMYENKGVFESISSSWEMTDEYGSKLFGFTLVFVVLMISSSLILSSILPAGIVQTSILAINEYLFVIPLGYIYFTLYKSLKER